MVSEVGSWWVKLIYRLYRYALHHEQQKHRKSFGNQKHPVSIQGTSLFKQNINHVLDELQTKAPIRYTEAIMYLPQVIFLESQTPEQIRWQIEVDDFILMAQVVGEE